MRLDFRGETGEYKGEIVSDPECIVQLPELPHQEYTEDYPRYLRFAVFGRDSSEMAALITLELDIDSWECLQRSAEGYLKDYLGTEYPRVLEGFLEALRAKAWGLHDASLIVSSGDGEHLSLRRMPGGVQLR
ncbi:unnamed protein product [marine sediment metagenome]|uniref:Uncharacterized protein n=1 Tax=marine sediment metagenome TaxID=412755 RepID=X0RG03_9ZZZZ